MLQLTKICKILSCQYGVDIYIGLRQNHRHHDLKLTGEVAKQQAESLLESSTKKGSDEWLYNFATPPSTTPTSINAASIETYKGCKCPSHQDIYSEWPMQDAELTIAQCMRTCVYCGKSFPVASELRKHIKKRYAKRNLTVTFDTRGKWSSSIPGWTRRRCIGSLTLTPKARTAPTHASPKVTINEELQGYRKSLALASENLGKKMTKAMDRLMARLQITMKLEEFEDLARLREEWELTQQCMRICDEANTNLDENSSSAANIIDNGWQYLVSTDGKTINSDN
jgi:hypothetical protein